MTRFIKFIDSDKADWLQQNYPNAFLLLALIARRARRFNGHPDEFEIGWCQVGDYKSAGISRQQYRRALEVLEIHQFIEIICKGKNDKRATINSTIKNRVKGTIVKLIDSSIWEIKSENENEQSTINSTISQPSTQPSLFPRKNQKLNHQLNHEQESASSLFYKKESEKEKSDSPASRSPSFTKEEFEGIRIYCDAKGLPITDKDIQSWLSKYPVERITSNLALLLQRKEPFNIKIFVAALKENYAGESERLLLNRNLALNYKKKFGWSSLVITQQYCRCEYTGDSISFKLHSDQFEECLLKIYKTKQENFA